MTIRHSAGQYEVEITSLANALELLPQETRILTDKNVASVAAPHISTKPYLAVEPGESSKSITQFGDALSWLAKTNATRQSTVVALGGGVVGDLAGFVAASYMRGVKFIQIPTTLLAMVDSSLGGKVGIDLPEGKNLAGAFKPPNAVYVPIDLLRSLPERQFRNGMAEVLKTGFIIDAELAESLRNHVLTGQCESAPSVVSRCIELKARVVEADEFETNGLRAILNFGHTIGHAIEHAYEYGELLHGEAISIGMVLEAKLGENLGISPKGTAETVAEDLKRYGLPTRIDPNLNAKDLIAAMFRDKKAMQGSLAFSLLTGLGRCKLVREVPAPEVDAVLREG